MKFADVNRAMTNDQIKDEVLKLKKEQFNLRFQRRPASLKTPRASARSAATSPVSRRSLRSRRAAK